MQIWSIQIAARISTGKSDMAITHCWICLDDSAKVACPSISDHRTNLNYYISSIDQDDKGELYWRSTGQTVRYNNWASKKPKTSAQPCVLINRFSFEWMSQDCSTAGPALCEKGK